MKAKQIVTAVSLVFALVSSNSYATGIPVIDAANLANTFENLVQWGKQLTEMKNQLEQQKATFESLNGLRNVASLLKNDLLTQALPKDYQKAVNDLLNNGGGDFASVSGALKDIIQVNQKYTCAQLNSTQANIKACEAQWNKLALDKNVGETGYKQAAKNIENLEQFVNQINSTTDPKAMQDIQARIQLEQVRINNEQIKLDTVKMMMEADAKLKTQRHSDAMKAGLDLGADGGISF